jgi:NAD(P)-dependent dehydrogenase (short-subunit alcohol dehydrogenase family)
MSKISFTGEIAIITGAGRGLGRAYALELAGRGAGVVVNDIGRDKTTGVPWAESVAAEITAAGGMALASTQDISTPDGGQALVDATVARFGTVDILINNAGFLRPAPFEDITAADLQAVVGVHLLAAFYVTQPAWRVMQKKNYGRIVMTASGSTFGHAENSNYSAAKAGVFGLSQTLALEGEVCGIKVNCVFPICETQMSSDTPLGGNQHGRLSLALAGLAGRRPPISVAYLTTYLASRACAVSGHTYSAAGGRYARVFLGLTDGWLAADVGAVSAEAIEAHIGEIDSTAKMSVPVCLAEEIEGVGHRIQVLKAV